VYAAAIDPGAPVNANVQALSIVIDENGVGAYTVKQGGVTASGKLTFMIGPADGFPNVLIYNFPILPDGSQLMTQDSWLQVLDASPLGPTPGDTIHFHGSTLCFYSDSLDELKAQFADIGLPAPPPGALVATVPEIGPEGSNSATYKATNHTTGAVATYLIISDTPEPATLLLGWPRPAGVHRNQDPAIRA
jgi:hypothetical protein